MVLAWDTGARLKKKWKIRDACAEIDFPHPGAKHEAAQEIPDHGGIREQEHVRPLSCVGSRLPVSSVPLLLTAAQRPRRSALVETADRPEPVRPGGHG